MKVTKFIAGAALAMTATSVTAAPEAGGDALTGDATKGKRLYAQCQACHAAIKGQNRVGPSLFGIVGGKAGQAEGFRYSDANLNSGVTWTEDTLSAFLESPRTFMPGTRMIYPGMRKPQDRADVIAYLKTLSD